MTTNSAIVVRGVSKKFRLFTSPKQRLYEALHPLRKQYHREFGALRDVSFGVAKGEIVGILGRNGSGKSTLLQIICGVMSATEGDVQVHGNIAALLELGAGFNPEFTGRENVILNGAIMGFSRPEMLRRMADIEAFADIGEFFDQPVKTYSSGMFVRVAFSAAIHVDPEILIVDEALSVGDASFQHRCFQRIRAFMEQGKTILIVSHNTDTLLRICNRGIVLDAGHVHHIGSIASAVDKYSELLYGSIGEKLKSPTRRNAEIDHGDEDQATGDTRPSLSSLQQGQEDKVFEKASYDDHEKRLGNGQVRIVDFDIVVEGALNPPVIPSHKDVELFVKLAFAESVDNVILGFALLSIDGTYVYGTHINDLSQAGGENIVVKIRWKSHLSGGEYFISLGCHTVVDGEKCFLDVRRSFAKLKFADTPGVVGFVDLEMAQEIVVV